MTVPEGTVHFLARRSASSHQRRSHPQAAQACGGSERLRSAARGAFPVPALGRPSRAGTRTRRGRGGQETIEHTEASRGRCGAAIERPVAVNHGAPRIAGSAARRPDQAWLSHRAVHGVQEVGLQAGSAEGVRDLDRHRTGTCRATGKDCQVDLWGPGRRMLLARSALVAGRSWRGRPREAGPNLKRDNPQEPRPVDRRANPPAPDRLGPWGSSVPRGTLTAFPSLARESLVLRPEGRFDLTTVTGVARTHRPAVRRPGPSALLAGAPTRISRSSRIRPSGQLNSIGAQEVAVKATFPLASRVCPASGGSNYSDGIWGDEPSPHATGAHRFSGTATGGHGAQVAAWSPGAPLQAAGRRVQEGVSFHASSTAEGSARPARATGAPEGHLQRRGHMRPQFILLGGPRALGVPLACQIERTSLGFNGQSRTAP
jgi:hypothetical protein